MENEKLSNKFVQKYDSLSDGFVVVQSTEDVQKQKREPFSFFRFKPKAKAMESEPNRPANESINQPVVNPPAENIAPPSNGGSKPTTPDFDLPSSQKPLPQQLRPHREPNNPVVLAKNFHNRLVVLGSLYETMAKTYPEHKDLFDDLYSETQILQATALVIYQTLSGNNFRPEQNKVVPTLYGNLCKDLIIVQNYLQETIDLCLALQRAVNVQNIDRQLFITNATLLSQKSKLSSLQAQSCNN